MQTKPIHSLADTSTHSQDNSQQHDTDKASHLDLLFTASGRKGFEFLGCEVRVNLHAPDGEGCAFYRYRLAPRKFLPKRVAETMSRVCGNDQCIMTISCILCCKRRTETGFTDSAFATDHDILPIRLALDYRGLHMFLAWSDRPASRENSTV